MDNKIAMGLFLHPARYYKQKNQAISVDTTWLKLPPADHLPPGAQLDNALANGYFLQLPFLARDQGQGYLQDPVFVFGLNTRRID
jgi:hypothetical protein